MRREILMDRGQGLEIVKKSFVDIPLLAVEGDLDHICTDIVRDAVHQYRD
jgi:hypothetical protein